MEQVHETVECLKQVRFKHGPLKWRSQWQKHDDALSNKIHL